MTMTPEEIAKNQAEWAAKAAKAKQAKNEAAGSLTAEQRKAIKIAWGALNSAEYNIREMFDIDMDDARNISRAEGHLRMAFPGILEEDEL